jgi:hypothetical protein
MNPWKIIGWIVLGGLVLVIGSCGLLLLGMAGQAERSVGDGPQTSRAEKRAPPPYSVRVSSVECEGVGSRAKAEVTVDNNGTEIPFAKVFVEFLDKGGTVVSASDSYFSPHTIPQAARASASVYSGSGDTNQCRVVRIQDGDGNPVKIL